MNVLNVQPKVKTKEAFTMENKKDKVALNDELLDKVSGGVDDEFRPNPNEGKTFYHVFHLPVKKYTQKNLICAKND